ncbi:DNA polymerase III subunit gamma/tau [Faecalitalea cylindroides]|uniref:DNA polymerase III subunit gamma/tau n=1 Tax=Faecalitalea cylindroides TaxID=39483 RepID=UPI00232AA405|nr:DNA polymerase III subunit gamma/tau [Faecalitalea cylindroides]MDB7952123.1 DNA polymerase III subunit gamma/tau [Faecalitalea cylindroides]MDB7958780.1 DNA polymerase III subunit gamma/tau [Faecalitalea cylindroides]MDB7960663.1 DNA polymerase III subunit gamma/tau [Faecalitalea cylindroides]MDB7962592.1 DNA polymerase III subunit gamma/tau [Faecalitalea cylindroides]MDB7964258.1 DNA polymerase III subunit gamma/tau [Faecalitalea cylindroides]
MAYQALYRKYRPSNFDEVVGQQLIIQTLKNAIVQNRIAHAYLFCGPRGTGKTSIAKIFAKMLNCEDESNKPCGKCTNCKMVQNGSHPDIIEIDAASNNGVDEVRNLIDKVKYAPMQGKYKVYIIDEVHMMTTGAFNALLKTIEEPPAHVVFILATTEPNKVIPTIISRCQRFDFNKVSQKDIEKRLSIVCKEEKIEIDPEAISLIAQLADGGMRDSLSILDQCIAYCSSNITVDNVREIYGVLTTSDIGKLFEHLYAHEVDALIQQIQECSDKGMDLKRLTSDFITLLKESIILDYSSNSQLVSNTHKEVIEKYLLKSPSPFRFNVLNELMDVFNKYNYASNVLDYLETALLKSISNSYEIKSKTTRDVIEDSDRENEENFAKSSDLSYDLTSEKSEIDKKVPKNSENTGISELETISDVSRETLKEVGNKDSKIILNDEYILQLLVGANKTERKIDTAKMDERNMYLADLEYAKYANSLRNIAIVASGDKYIVVAVRSELEAKEINEMQLTQGFEDFMEQVLGKAKKIFAIDHIQQTRVLEEFKERMIQGTLPEPVDVIISRSNSSDKEKKLSEEEQMIELFPNIEIVND